MPMTQGFKDRLYPSLPAIAACYGTPFHIYDEIGIRETGPGYIGRKDGKIRVENIEQNLFFGRLFQ